MTLAERITKATASQRAAAVEGMAAARVWRSTYHPSQEERAGSCYKCDGGGIIKTWGGRAGEGGRVGPCPICRRQGAQRFVAQLARETFNQGE